MEALTGEEGNGMKQHTLAIQHSNTSAFTTSDKRQAKRATMKNFIVKDCS